jgi:SulP family sulfate permease
VRFTLQLPTDRVSQGDGTPLVLSGVRAQPLVALERSGLLARIGEENVHGNIREVLARARELVGTAAPAA